MKSISRTGWTDRLKAATLALGMGATLAAAAVPSPAQACGGFFCSAQQPVNQAAERIIFVTHEDGSVTAVIQVQYQGPSEQFSWVLPVEGAPEISVSSNVAFTRLQTNTNPNYTLNTEIEGECAPDSTVNRGVGGGVPVPSDAAFESADDGTSEPDVTVVSGGSVGPYDYEIISVNDQLEDPADVAIEWLTDNGYDVGELGPDVLRPYLAGGLNLAAFRLQKDAESGSIRPIALTFESSIAEMGQAANGRPSIPIRPTAVAANDNMGVMVWNVGPARSVPVNYRSLVLNDALINWFNATSNYNDVINIAADEAGGHGFVTEMAQPSTRVDDVVWGPFDESNWEDIVSSDWSGQTQDLMFRLSSFAGWDGLADAFRTAVNLPENVAPSSVANCPGCFSDILTDEGAAALIPAIEENVIEPMRATQDLLLEREYITRLYTTMSASEMTEDPVFDYNPALDDIDNQHTATRVVECNLAVSQFEAPWRVELPSGLVVRGEGQGNWPLSTDDDIPANLQVLQDNTFEQPEVVEDNTTEVNEKLAELNGAFPRLPAGACACATPGEGLAGTALGFSLVGLVGFAFRRRRR